MGNAWHDFWARVDAFAAEHGIEKGSEEWARWDVAVKELAKADQTLSTQEYLARGLAEVRK